MNGPDGSPWQFYYNENEFLEALYYVDYDWYSVDFNEEPLYTGYLLDENYDDSQFFAIIATYDQDFKRWMYYDSDNAYCELTAVMDDTGNPEVFYISEIPIEGFEGLCPYLSYWSESEVGTDTVGDFMYGPDTSKLYITDEYEFSGIVYGGDSGGDYSGDLPSEEPVWYEFIVNDDVESWAVVMSYDEGMQEFYLWTAANDICQLNIDYSTASATTYYLDI